MIGTVNDGFARVLVHVSDFIWSAVFFFQFDFLFGARIDLYGGRGSVRARDGVTKRLAGVRR